MADTDFVGRADYMARVLGPVGGPGRTGSFFDVEGVPGIGKTSLIDQLAAKAREDGIVIRIDGGEFEARARRSDPPTADDEAAELRVFRRLLQGALDDLRLQRHPEIGDFLNWMEANQPGQRQQPGWQASYVWQPSEPGEVIHYRDEYLRRAAEAANVQSRDLAAKKQRFLLLVDDFHLLAERPLGQWLIDLFADVKGADVVVAHQEFSHLARLRMPARVTRIPLGGLAFDDMEAYLKSHPGIGPDVTKIAGHVWEFTGGHPQALVLAADLIKDKSPEESVRLIRQLGAVQGGRSPQLEALVNRILDAIDDEELRDALYSVCVTRHFDGPLLERLLNVDRRHAQTLLDRLRHYSFIRESAVKYSFLQVSDFVRPFGEKHLGIDRTQEIHVQAAAYYHSLMAKRTAEAGGTSFRSWYLHENREFQALERDWLHHISRLTGDDRQGGRIGVAGIFLSVFWWWGCYIPFPFCEEILADWSEATLGDDEDRAWGRQLRTLYNSYPKKWRKWDVPEERWTTVRLALRYLWNHCRFDEPQADDREMRKIRGILAMFLADAAWYVDPGDPEVDAQLDDAAEQFAADGDEWDTAWVEFTRADLACSRGRAEPAIAAARECAQKHQGLGDDELLANLHRVCADALWAKDDRGAALDAYAHAVAHAYGAHATGVPDEYTDAFHQEMIERSRDRLVAWHADDQDEEHAGLRSACQRIRAFFGPYWRAVRADPAAPVAAQAVRALDEDRPDDVAAMLFPARPAATDLRRHGSKYALICEDVSYKMREELAQPPGTPLPPGV